MKRPRVPFLRGLTVQLLAVTVLPLTVLLLLIAFGSISLHQQDMRALVGQRDERAAQAAASAITSELHHRAATINNIAAFAALSENAAFPSSQDLAADFAGGVAYLDDNRRVLAATSQAEMWDWIGQNNISLASSSAEGPLFSDPFLEPSSGKLFVIVSQYSFARNIIVAGAFAPDQLASESITASYPATDGLAIYLLDSSGHLLFMRGTETAGGLPSEHPGVAEALRGESGTLYYQAGKNEHVIAYSPIHTTGWALITEEAWQEVVSPSLQATQMAPLVLVPAFVLSLVALWFAAKQIVQPLQKLESKAAALAWGDFQAIQEPVGGISEVQHLQQELTEMSRKVRAAQEGLHDYIGAITAAQEEERARLARELHDDTIQAVIALKQRVQLAKKGVKDSTTRQSLGELEGLADETVENLRRLTRALRPIYLEDLGLVTALEMLARETSQANDLEVNCHVSGPERRLPREVELALYRISQEALNNIVHHSGASHATLEISFDKEIKLEVTDNGVGFTVPKSPTDFAPSGHFGLLGMRERVELIGARLEVQSEAGKGTRLAVRLSGS